MQFVVSVSIGSRTVVVRHADCSKSYRSWLMSI